MPCNPHLVEISTASSPYWRGQKFGIRLDLQGSQRKISPSPSKHKQRTSTSTKKSLATHLNNSRNDAIQPRKFLTAFLEQHLVEQVPINYSSSVRTFYNISHEEKAETQIDIQKEIELDNSFHDTPELFSEIRVEPSKVPSECANSWHCPGDIKCYWH